ncbi:hypothetical protein IKF26_02590 [Candidatus Saccharibacteria bacterium]|nr:hypothetical protein [Candidatus Saccharibacteria bacterium]
MKRTHKKALGFLGLSLVVATTIFAASLPGPEALAATSTAFTDTIVVRVVGDAPNVNITSPANNAVYVNPSQNISFIYENVERVKVTLEYTDVDGNVHNYDLDTIIADYKPGSASYDIDLSNPPYGYGEYVVRITGTSEVDIDVEDSISFSYYPVTATVEKDDTTGKIYADLNYNSDSTDIDRFEITVYDENGDKVTKIPTITTAPPTKRVELPIAENVLAAGKYSIVITTYGTDGKALYKSYATLFVYDPEPIVVPNTGSFSGGLNISQTDYLITGLFVFFLVGISGLIWVGKDRKSSRK